MNPNTVQNNSQSTGDDSKNMTNSNPSFEIFIKQFEILPTPEEKLRSALLAMRGFVSQKENLPFREFWEVRKLCIPLFKENIGQKERNLLWNEYIELTREGRELKNLLDAEANFAAEQIEIAIAALEKEVDAYCSQSSDVFQRVEKLTIAEEIQALKKRAPFYAEKSLNLNLLNVFAERINALRKELIKIPIRFRIKNKFFQKLSDLGDRVFPPRRDLIKEVSTAFEEDVKSFVDTHFSEENFSHEKVKKMVFFFRDEIKALQAIAKVLTLNTQAFTETRSSLSAAWDKLKGMEKELKKHYSDQKQKSQENTILIQEEIGKIKAKIATEEICEAEVLSLCDEILQKMRGVELNRNDVYSLKDEIRLLKEPIFAKQEEELKLKKEKEAAFEEKRRQEIDEFKRELAALKEKSSTLALETIIQESESLSKKMETLTLSKKEKADCERILKRFAQEIEEKKEEALLSLSDDEKKVLSNLNEILDQRKERRQGIKRQIDEYRKILGGSQLDFCKAMEYNELIALEKERLEKIEEGILEIQKKIKELKKIERT